ncbi:MAG: HAD family hydrolase [Candidatus Gastranaerophilales bacterium]|nr:HAD family hydrolase [Candidatus Gastranaerophilales bacterium]
MNIYKTDNFCYQGIQNNNIKQTKNSYQTNFGSRVKLCSDIFVKQSESSETVKDLKHISFVGKNYKDKIQIVFSDIDKTLSVHSDFLSPRVLGAIDSLQEKKIPLVLTTARCYKDVLPISNQFAHKPDYTIALQGGSIIDKNGVPIIENSINRDVGNKLCDWFENTFSQDSNSHLIMYFDDEAYSLSNVQFPWKARSPITQVESFSKLFDKGMKLQKAILFKSKANMADDIIVQNAFKESNIEELSIARSGMGFYEFQDKNVSKGKAIKYVLERLNINPENAMAIGDSSNDIEMLDFINEHNGLSVAMGNAKSNVKQHANAVTSSVYQNGFAEVIDFIV